MYAIAFILEDSILGHLLSHLVKNLSCMSVCCKVSLLPRWFDRRISLMLHPRRLRIYKCYNISGFEIGHLEETLCLSTC